MSDQTPHDYTLGRMSAGWLSELGRDLRQATRSLGRSPTFTAAAVLTLALGIGATTVIFSVVDHIVLRPLPYPDPERLVLVREVIGEIRATYPSLPANAGHFLEWRRRCRGCGELAALRQYDLTLTGTGDPERTRRSGPLPACSGSSGPGSSSGGPLPTPRTNPAATGWWW